MQEAQYNAKSIEEKIGMFWEVEGIYPLVRKKRATGKKFFFVDGPPYTTGRIHLGTAWNKIIKDCVLRYKSMCGLSVLDRAGWDMHGLPIEVKLEEVLGFSTKKDIENYGVDRFVEECKKFAFKNESDMTAQFKRLGAWLDWDNPYRTLKDEYIEAEWWTLKRAFERGLLEEGLRVVNWCPRCETALAEAEVEYQDVSDVSIYVKFPLGDNRFIVVWTTTPWTIPSNIAVAVHPDYEYVEVLARKDGKEEKLMLSGALAEAVLKKCGYEYEVLSKTPGKKLAGLTYRHPLDDVIAKQKVVKHAVYTDEFVALEEGTGCVHIAPGFGEEDFALGKKHGLEAFCPVDSRGMFTEEAGKYAGKEVRKANKEVVKDLYDRGFLLHDEIISHSYGHCWRCKTPIIFLATRQWFIKISEIKDEMLEAIKKVAWYPEWAGSARFADWLSQARDWCISRQRYWGTPLPIWKCGSCGRITVVGTVEELRNKAVEMPQDLQLHIPGIDRVVLRCECGGRMNRVRDIFDVWFDSAVASWATLGFPQKKELFDALWPADFITEGHDQTRGWFYSQLGASMVAFQKAPYRSVLMHGFTLDEAGRKMSKSLGNVIDPEEVIEKYGADTLRLYVLSSSAPWDDMRFSWSEAANSFRTLNIFWNVCRFSVSYMQLDGFSPDETTYEKVKEVLRTEDWWILARLQTVIKEVTEGIETYSFHRAIRALANFMTEDVSRWYVPLVRPRTWVTVESADKMAAYFALHHVLHETTKMLAPFAPFMAEKAYQGLAGRKEKSVHLLDWAKVDSRFVDKKLEKEMEVTRGAVEAVKKGRQSAQRKLRWPVKRIVMSPDSGEVRDALEAMEKVIMEQTNAKKIIVLREGKKWEEVKLETVPVPAKIGPKFKQNANKVIAALKMMDGEKLQQKIKEGYERFGGKITKDMVTFREKLPDGVVKESFEGGTVYIDTKVTPQIEAEGYSRELIRRIQEMRKEMNLDVEEKVDVSILISGENVAKLVNQEKWAKYIGSETRAKKLSMGAKVKTSGFEKEWDVEGVKVKIGVEKLN